MFSAARLVELAAIGHLKASETIEETARDSPKAKRAPEPWQGLKCALHPVRGIEFICYNTNLSLENLERKPSIVRGRESSVRSRRPKRMPMNATNDMVRDEADQHYAALGLTRGKVASITDVTAAFRRLSREGGHPDTGGRAERFIALKAAYDWFKQKLTEQASFFTIEALRYAGGFGASGGYDAYDGRDGNDDRDAHDGGRSQDGLGACPYDGKVKTRAMDFIHEYMSNRGLVIDARGVISPRNGYKTIKTHTVEEVLRERDITFQRLLDELKFHRDRTHAKGDDGLSNADLKYGLGTVIGNLKLERRAAIFEGLMSELSKAEKIDAELAWSRLADTAFDGNAAVVVAILKKLIHQVKRKALKEEVENHLVPVIFSPHQGLGKSRFVRELLGPLEELFGGNTNASALVDQSNIGLFDHPVIFLDDMQGFDEKQIAALKDVISADELTRRVYFTQDMQIFRQKSTLIATTNVDITRVVPDPTGHRRFGQMLFKFYPPGPERKKAWDVINQTNWSLLWRSVGHEDPDPIKGVLPFLQEQTTSQTPEGRLRQWVRKLDLNRPEIAATRMGTVEVHYIAADLFAVYVTDTGGSPSLTVNDFRRILDDCCRQGIGPFDRPDKHQKGKSYRP